MRRDSFQPEERLINFNGDGFLFPDPPVTSEDDFGTNGRYSLFDMSDICPYDENNFVDNEISDIDDNIRLSDHI